MEARTLWRTVTPDKTDLLDRVLALLDREQARFCAIGGVAVNAYVEPVVTLDLDLVVAAADRPAVERALAGEFSREPFEHSVNVAAPGSDLRVRIQTDPRYLPFVDRATVREVLGVRLPVATVEDVLQGKVWAVSDPTRRASKRQKDLADIARLLESYPELRSKVPQDLLERLF